MLEHGPSTAAELAGRLGLTAAAIRRHLDGLTERGLITSREQRVYGARGRGRPAKVFELTDAGRADFYQAYDELAIAALKALAETAGQHAVTELARSRMADVEQRYRSIRDAAEAVDGAIDSAAAQLTPAQALAAALSDEGYVASTKPAVAGEQVCQHHCPVAHVAAQFPQLCEVETETFSRLLGVHVQRLATIAHGDGVCTTHVPHLDQVLPHLDQVRAEGHRLPGRPDDKPVTTTISTSEAGRTSKPETGKGN
ncbi:helix-turn-helix transcriptional regulator [Microlunatus elymi]|uniref:helix-turn-helix transcriptional regulator n=1 Tax=Microlunatus elymi TaxID=2596828 RepID=UPI001D1909A8|nr:HTH domain-containing protein [Microlunatus elymi]